MARIGEVKRSTAETDIFISIDLDGSGDAMINTGIGFFDHMLQAFARHGLFDLTVEVEGDLYVDCHHSIEDVGIVLGQAIAQALGEKNGIRRYGNFYLPMDEALVLCAIDLSGRPYLNYDLNFTMPSIGKMDTEMIREFFYAVSYGGMMNLHLKQLDGVNNHHLAEAAFKAFAKALDQATIIDPRIEGVLSTKESL